MTVASERDVQSLRQEYKGMVTAKEGVACYYNALRASLAIYVISGAESLPRIMTVDTEEKGAHAYLVYKEKVYNEGVTWPNKTYPDYSLDELKTVGRDDTVELYIRAWQELSGDTFDNKNLGLGAALAHTTPVELIESILPEVIIRAASDDPEYHHLVPQSPK